MDLPQPGQQGSGAKGRKGVAAFQMDQMHVSGEQSRTSGTNRTRKWKLPFSGCRKVTRTMKYFETGTSKQRLIGPNAAPDCLHQGPEQWPSVR